ncbi:SCO2523 family variant P-loop protein [Yinghuangia soli]|uniref:SCO2523 family variant P-loop protein n=1 Tax=Yinghuangia soli TaxID=2908204 RepID=A0AA41U2C6_9ACTN|nr:SCO2523 family variant P-loop protein [Yinghuangia soli]MCF2528482.1 SCO2523 family variant P-loop protein [Yinghuangia soli]
MLVFAASDKGGTGRSVTSANIAYQCAVNGRDVCYLDFDFGSPTAAAVFDVPSALRGIDGNGLHSYLQGGVTEPRRIDVWAETEHRVLRNQPVNAGRLALFPGDRGGGEFVIGRETVRRCVTLFLRLEEEFDVVLVDLSAGRSYAMDMVLEVTARPELKQVTSRWMVFHRWTRQHVIAAAGLMFGARGILEAGAARGHDKDELAAAIRPVRAAVPDPDGALWASVPLEQASWMRACNEQLRELAAEHGIGNTRKLGAVPLEPVLQWREQLITIDDVTPGSGVANIETWLALEELSKALFDDEMWRSP